jgi:hypothetical protein
VHFLTISKRSFDVTVQSAQHPDARMHHEVPVLGRPDQATDRGPPFLEILLGLRQFYNVIGDVFEGD